MKIYLYCILLFLSDGLAFLNVRDRADRASELLRIMYLEKSSFAEFSFDPFPLFIMMSYVLNTILSISYITSNSLTPGNCFILSRFDSSRRCIVFVYSRMMKAAVLCALIQSAVPAALSVYAMGLCRIGEIITLFSLYFLRQAILLGCGALIALLVRKGTLGAAMEIIGSLFILLLVTADLFMPCAIALIDISAKNSLTTATDAAGLMLLSVLYCSRFGKSGDKLDERL